MGGSSIEKGSENTPALTLVLVGKTGNGKSATGNSIIGSTKFESKRSSAGVTTVCEMNTTVLKDGRKVNVIDTPGLFDSFIDPVIGKEIVNCIDMATDGIHAVLVVFSVCNRFSDEEKAVISCLETLFGSKIYDYMIVVFTGGDELEADGKSLDSFIRDSTESLKGVLCLCGNRRVLFNNRTKDEAKKANQVQELFPLVTMVLEKNDYKPYTSEIFAVLKKKKLLYRDVEALMDQMHEKQLNGVIEMFASKFVEIQVKHAKLLDEERAARLKAEENAKKERAALLKAEENAKKERAALLKAEENAKLLDEERAARLKAEENAKKELAARLKAEENAKKERAARLKAEENAKKSEKEIKRLEKELKKVKTNATVCTCDIDGEFYCISCNPL